MQLVVRQTFFAMVLAFLFLSGRAFGGSIHSAAISGNLEMVKTLLATNTDLVSSKDGNGDTPLHLAVRHHHEDMAKQKEMAELLLANGAKVNEPGPDDWTPLHVAVQNDHKDVVELLLDHKADINAKTKEGETPLHVAESQDEKDIAELLRQHGGKE